MLNNPSYDELTGEQKQKCISIGARKNWSPQIAWSEVCKIAAHDGKTGLSFLQEATELANSDALTREYKSLAATK